MTKKSELIEQAVSQIGQLQATFSELAEASEKPEDKDVFERGESSMAFMAGALKLMIIMDRMEG